MLTMPKKKTPDPHVAADHPPVTLKPDKAGVHITNENEILALHDMLFFGNTGKHRQMEANNVIQAIKSAAEAINRRRDGKR